MVIGCGADYATGVYHLSDLDAPRFGPERLRYFTRPPRADASDQKKWPQKLRAVVLDTSCPQRPVVDLTSGFERVASRATTWGRGHDIWLPRIAVPAPPKPATPAALPKPAPPVPAAKPMKPAPPAALPAAPAPRALPPKAPPS